MVEVLVLECEGKLLSLLQLFPGNAPHGSDAENQQGLYLCLCAVFMTVFCFISAVEMEKPPSGLVCELPILLHSSGDNKLR